MPVSRALGLNRRSVLGLVPAMLLPAVANAQERPAGTISIEQTQVGFIFGTSWGSGTLRFAGRSYRFKLKGLGIGEIGVASVQAYGEVYGLKRIEQFPGTYALVQASATGGNASAGRGIWLSNRAGVKLNLRSQRQGLQLTLGADGLVIEMA